MNILNIFIPRPVYAVGDSVAPPSTWINSIAPPGILPPGGGLDFIVNSAVPSVISLLLFLIFSAGLLFTIIGGIMIMTSGGNKEGTAKAKNTVTYALLGVALALASFVILTIIGNFFGVKLLII